MNPITARGEAKREARIMSRLLYLSTTQARGMLDTITMMVYTVVTKPQSNEVTWMTSLIAYVTAKMPATETANW